MIKGKESAGSQENLSFKVSNVRQMFLNVPNVLNFTESSPVFREGKKKTQKQNKNNKPQLRSQLMVVFSLVGAAWRNWGEREGVVGDDWMVPA